MNNILPGDTDTANLILQDLEAGRISAQVASLRFAQLAQGHLELLDAGTSPDPEMTKKLTKWLIRDGTDIAIKAEGLARKK
ncbi:MAG: hypothetical protein WC851_02435 [Candidatus Shapirobacteria bacterium]|jgi:hypothetical protein